MLRCSCGGKYFIGKQRVHGTTSVVVNEYGTFQMFVGEEGVMDESDLEFDKPKGPWTCEDCGETIAENK